MAEITINLHDQPCGNCTVCIGRTIGAKHEQERIIKLLETWSCGLDDCAEWQLESKRVIELCSARNSIIALIKGEK